MSYMYENNYNYVEVPGEGKDKKKDNKVAVVTKPYDHRGTHSNLNLQASVC